MPDTASSAVRVAVARPLYSQVRDLLLERIRRGDWGTGDALPNEFQLASQFSVSIGTIRRAISELEEAGIVVRKQGRGTYLNEPGNKMTRKLWALRSADGSLLEVTYRLEGMRRRSVSPSEALRLQCPTTSEVFEIDQTLCVAEATVGCEQTVVEARRFPKLETQLRFGQDLGRLFADYGLILVRAVDTVAAAVADRETASRLATTEGSLLLQVMRISHAIDQRPAELKQGVYLASDLRHQSEFD
jgi:GntR family transcriptional regulator